MKLSKRRIEELRRARVGKRESASSVEAHGALKEGRHAVERGAARRAAANFSVRLLSLQEEVQQRIASDLHDSTCQHLIAASLNLLRMRRAIGDIGSAERICDDIEASIDQALREIRAFTYLLHPQNLLADGLKGTIEQFVDGFSARTSLKKVDLEIAPEVDRLSYERQCSVLRVIQEALANVFRHAKATQVTLAMEATDTHFKLRISDNGCGMPVSQARSGRKAISFGVGIPAMRVRLQQMGGSSKSVRLPQEKPRNYLVRGHSALATAQESARRTASWSGPSQIHRTTAIKIGSKYRRKRENFQDVTTNGGKQHVEPDVGRHWRFVRS